MQAATTQAGHGASRLWAPALRLPCCRRSTSCSSRPCTPRGGAGCTEGRRRRRRSCPGPRCPSCLARRAPAARRLARRRRARRTCRRGRLRARPRPAAPRPSCRHGTLRAQMARRARSRYPPCRSLGACQARRGPWRRAQRAGAGPRRTRWGPRARTTAGARMPAGPGGTHTAPAGRGGASAGCMRPCRSSRMGACRAAGRHRSGPLLPGCMLASAALPPAALKRAWNAAAPLHRAYKKPCRSCTAQHQYRKRSSCAGHEPADRDMSPYAGSHTSQSTVNSAEC